MQQMIRPVSGIVRCTITVPGSKSITYRALLLAALADGVSEITAMRIDDNTRAFVNALYQLGIVAQLDETAGSCIVAGGDGKFPKKAATIWCDDAKSILRFLLAATASTPGTYHFDGSVRLKEFSISKLLNVLRLQGVQFLPSDARKLPFTLIGADSLEGGEVLFDQHIQSQVVSALLMIAPFARSAFQFTLVDVTHQPNIDLTCALMAEFGVLVHRIHQGQFMVPVPQRYQPKDYVVEPDFSYALYFFAAAAATAGEVTLQMNKQAHSTQKTSKFLSLLERMGCKIVETERGLTVIGNKALQGVEVQLRQVADVFLALAALAPFAITPTRIHYALPLRKTEWERLQALQSEFTKAGIRIEAGEDWIVIFPSSPQSGVLSAHQDHHLAMALSIFGLKVPGIIIDDNSNLSHIFPEFYMLWNKLATEQQPYKVGVAK